MKPFGTWLAEIGLGRYGVVFASNQLDYDVIRSLTDADLRELGLALGDRKRLLQAVVVLDEQRTADTINSVVTRASNSEPLRQDWQSLPQFRSCAGLFSPVHPQQILPHRDRTPSSSQ